MNKLFLNQIEIDITNKCNLNCASCTHFSPLVKEEQSYAINEFENDIRRMFDLFVINKIKLVGGEPLLHNDLFNFIDIMFIAYSIT